MDVAQESWVVREDNEKIIGSDEREAIGGATLDNKIR